MHRVLLLTLTIIMMTATYAAAERPFGMHGWGPRGGATINPDQVHMGAHFDLGDFAPRVQFMPHVEVGFGDDVTLLAPMFEVNYRFREDWGSWSPYAGGGIGPVFRFRDTRDNTDLGVAIQGGIARQLNNGSSSVFFEFKVGLADYPDAKFTVGWNFGRRHKPAPR